MPKESDSGEVLRAEPFCGSRINWFRYRAVLRISNPNTKAANRYILDIFLMFELGLKIQDDIYNYFFGLGYF